MFGNVTRGLAILILFLQVGSIGLLNASASEFWHAYVDEGRDVRYSAHNCQVSR